MGCGCGTTVRTNLTKQTNNITVNNTRTSTKKTSTMRRKIIPAVLSGWLMFLKK